MAYARQKLLLQKLQTEDEERRGVRTPQQQSTGQHSGQRFNFSSSYQSEFINHTQSSAEQKFLQQQTWRLDSHQPATMLSQSMPQLSSSGSPLYQAPLLPAASSLGTGELDEHELQNALAVISEEDFDRLVHEIPENVLSNTIADPTYMREHLYDTKTHDLDLDLDLEMAPLQHRQATSCPADVSQPATVARRGGRQKQPAPRHMSEEQREAWERDRARKDSHNKIERKRRDAINDRIMYLAQILPPSADLDSRDMKPCKGTVLRQTVDYIKTLQKDQNKLRVTSSHLKQTQDMNRKMLLHIQQLEVLLQRNGISQPAVDGVPSSQQFLAEIVSQQTQQLSSHVHIKQEPVDLVTVPTPTSYSVTSEGFVDDESMVGVDPMMSLTSSPTGTTFHHLSSQQTSPGDMGDTEDYY